MLKLSSQLLVFIKRNYSIRRLKGTTTKCELRLYQSTFIAKCKTGPSCILHKATWVLGVADLGGVGSVQCTGCQVD